MNLYRNAEKWHIAAKNALKSEDYQASVFNSCLAVELYLKSKIMVVDPSSELERSHDVIAMYTRLGRVYPSKKELKGILTDCRKYFNESRYPFGDDSVYDKKFAEKFLQHVNDIRSYIDNECHVDTVDLQMKFESESKLQPSSVDRGGKRKK